MFTFPKEYEVLPGGCITCWKMLPRGRLRAHPPALHTGKWEVEYEGKRWRASRLSYHLNVEPIPRQPPKGGALFALHKCDNEWRINPDHIYMGTIKQNTADKFARHPTIRKILSKASNWNNRSEESKAKVLKNLWGQKGKPSYERTPESRQKSAASQRLAHARRRAAKEAQKQSENA